VITVAGGGARGCCCCRMLECAVAGCASRMRAAAAAAASSPKDGRPVLGREGDTDVRGDGRLLEIPRCGRNSDSELDSSSSSSL
jgi:hypothetical protein